MNTSLREGESLVRQGAANMWRGAEAVGGKLYLTSQRLVFEPHRFNLQTGVTVVELSSIAGARSCSTLFVVPNGMEVRLADGTCHKFVLWHRSQWIDAIKMARSRLGAA